MLRLIRLGHTYKENRKHQTVGRLLVPGKTAFAVIELPWQGNETGISCISPGPQEKKRVYKLKIRHTEASRFPYPHIHLLNVPDRKWILIHRANFVEQLRGCVAIGTSLQILRGKTADVINSTQALRQLISIVKKQDIDTISVEWQERSSVNFPKELKLDNAAQLPEKIPDSIIRPA